MDTTSSLLTLFSSISMPSLAACFPSSSTGVTMREFVMFVQRLQAKQGQQDVPNSPMNVSPSKMNPADRENIVDLYKQVDARGEGMIKWSDFSSYVMNVEVDALHNAKTNSTDTAYHYSDVPDPATYKTPISQLSYFPAPISRLCMFTENNENLELKVLPDGPTYLSEMPRAAMKAISHHTHFKQHHLLSTIQIEDEDNIISSSIMDNGKDSSQTRLGGFISLWDIPTEEERREGTQYLADLKTRFQTEFPQHHLCWSSREDVLFSGSDITGQILCTRIQALGDGEDDGEEAVQEYKQQAQALRRAQALEATLTNPSRSLSPPPPLRTDPPELRELLELRQKLYRDEIAAEEKIKKKEADKKIHDRAAGLAENETNVFEAEAAAKRQSLLLKKKHNFAAPAQTMQKKIRCHSSGVSGIKELRTTDGSNFLVIASHDGSIVLLDLAKPYMESKTPEQYLVRRVNAHELGIKCLAFSSLYDVLFTAGVSDSTDAVSSVFVWDTDPTYGLQSSSKTRLEPHTVDAQIADIQVVDDEAHVVTCTTDCHIYVYSLLSFSCIQYLPPPSLFPTYASVSSIAISPPNVTPSPDPKMPDVVIPPMLTIAADKLYLYHFKTLDIFEPLITSFYNSAFHNFVTVSAARISIWDGHKGALLRVYQATKLFKTGLGLQPQEITSCTTDSTGRKLIVGDETGQIMILNYMSGSIIKYLDPHQGGVTFLDYSAKEKCVVSTGMDGIMHVADDIDSDGFILQKPGNNQAGRSVVIRSLEINTNLTTFKGKDEDHHNTPASSNNAIGGDRKASRLGSPPTLPHGASSSNLLHRNQSSKFDMLTQAGVGNLRRASANSNSNHSVPDHTTNFHIPNHHLGNIAGMMHHAHVTHDHTNEHVRPMHKMLGGSSENVLGSFAPQSSLRRLSSVGGGAGGRRNSLSRSPTRKMSFLGNGMANSNEAHSELTNAAFSRHLNVIATATTTGSGEHHCHVWDYETCTLVGTCVHPNALPGEAYEVSALATMSPRPYLLGAMNTGFVYIWVLPTCVCKMSLVPAEGVNGRWCNSMDEAEKIRSKTTISSICVVNLDSDENVLLHDSETNVKTIMVFVSDEKGVMFCWRMDESDFDAGDVNRRRASFNPRRVVKSVVGGDELTHYRRIARSYQKRSVRIRTPSFSWKAHEDAITSVTAVDGSRNIVTSSQDCMCKIWNFEGEIVGQLDLNRGGGGGEVPWTFAPEVKIQESNRDKFHDLWGDDAAAQLIDNKIKGMKQQQQKSSEGAARRGSPGGGGRVHRVTTWNRTQPQKKKKEKSFEAEVVEADKDGLSLAAQSEKHWDDMMDNLHVFKTALEEHTHERQEREEVRRKGRRSRADAPLEGKHWKISSSVGATTEGFGGGGKKTIPRLYELMRPNTSPAKGARGGGELGAGLGLGVGRVRPSSSASVSIAMGLQHTGYFA